MALVRFNEAKSNRGRSLLSFRGFEYCYERDANIEEGWEYWRCPVRPPYCPGRASVQMAWQFDKNGTRYKMGRVTAGHNHPENFAKYSVREANERIRAEAESDFPTTSRNIVRTVRAGLPVGARKWDSRLLKIAILLFIFVLVPLICIYYCLLSRIHFNNPQICSRLNIEKQK